MVAQDAHEEAPVPWRGIVKAEQKECGDGDVEADGDEEDALFEPGGVRVDVGYVDGGFVEGVEEGCEGGGGG